MPLLASGFWLLAPGL